MWIQSHSTLATHPKMYRLMRLMNWEASYAIGTLIMFWWWCLSYAPDGDLRRYDSAELGTAAGLSGEEADHFPKAMIQAGFLDETPYFRVHDWWDYAGPLLRAKHKRNPHIWKHIRDLYEVKYTKGTDGQREEYSNTPNPQSDGYSKGIHT